MTAVIPEVEFPVPDAVRTRYRRVTDSELWLDTSKFKTGTFKSPGIWVASAGVGVATDISTKGRVGVEVGVFVAVSVGVFVAVSVPVLVAVKLFVDVSVGVLVPVLVKLLVGVKVLVSVFVAVFVALLVAVKVFVSVIVGVFVAVLVAVLEGVGVGVAMVMVAPFTAAPVTRIGRRDVVPPPAKSLLFATFAL